MFSSSSSSKGKSSGLRILWIPGGRKSHPKGRYSSTSKKVSYSTQPKRKNEMWSLGGSRNQKGLLDADPDTALLDGPSVSGLTTVSCALGTATVVGKCINSEEILSIETQTEPADASSVTTPLLESTTDTDNTKGATTTTTTTTTITTTTNEQPQQQPASPNSTTSTALLVSPPISPSSISEMPSKTAAPPSNTITTTITKAEVIDDNRFALLDNDPDDIIELHRLRRPPPRDDELSLQMNSLPDMPQTPSSSSVTTRSTTSSSPRSNSNNSNSDSNHSSPVKKKHRHRNHNNNHPQLIVDLNTIESIHEEAKVPVGPVDWIDELVKDTTLAPENTENGTLKTKNRKKRSSKDMDQLDGVSKKSVGCCSDSSEEDDEKLATCLYYTLMCCDCAIS